MSSKWEVDLDLVEAWLLELDQRSYELVIAAVELLGETVPNWDAPSSTPWWVPDTGT